MGIRVHDRGREEVGKGAGKGHTEGAFPERAMVAGVRTQSGMVNKSLVHLYSPINGSNRKAQQHDHKYKQNESSDQVHHKIIITVVKPA